MRILTDDLSHYNEYMRTSKKELPPEIPASAVLPLPALTVAPVVKTSVAPYREFCAMADRVVTESAVIDPWLLWSSLDSKQRRTESTESALAKAMRRVHPGVPYTIGSAPAGATKGGSAMHLPLNLYRGAICCMASESEHFRSCMRSGSDYAGGIPVIIAAGGMALVKGSLLSPAENRKRIWVYLNHDATGVALGRNVYGDWTSEELFDAVARLEATLGLPVLGTFNGDTANRMGLSKSSSVDPGKDAVNAVFKTGWYNMRTEWRTPYTDGLQVVTDSTNASRLCLAAQSWWPIKEVKKAAKAGTKEVASDSSNRVLRVKLVEDGADIWLHVLEQSHLNNRFAYGPQAPANQEFTFRGVSVISETHPELRIMDPTPAVFVWGTHVVMNDPAKGMPYRAFAKSAADKALYATNVARIIAAIRAYNTDPETDPVEYVKWVG
jgi:hypothetical protein